MRSKGILIRNGVFSGLQIGLNSLGLLGAYRVISIKLGIAAIGAWAICLSIASLTSIFDGGASDALVRQIAHVLARGDRASAARIFATAIVMCVVGSCIGGVALYFSANHLVSGFIAARNQTTFANFFGFALVVGALNVSGNACVGVLEGLERYDLKLALSFGGVLLFFTAVVILVPTFGTTGMIVAFAIQAAFMVFVGLAVVAAKLPLLQDRNWLPTTSYAAELVRVGLPLKAFGLTSFALEPLTRLFVGSFGGMRAAGIYEVAARVITQLRGLLVGIVQVSLPRFVSLSVSDPAQRSATEALSVRITAAAALCAFTSLVLLLPWVSQLLTGKVDPDLCLYALVLSFGWFMNTLCAPYFYATVAAAQFRSIWTTMVIMAAVNGAAGYLLGLRFGPFGSVCALSIAVAAGSIYIIAARIRRLGQAQLPYGWPEMLMASTAVFALVATVSLPYRNLGRDDGLRKSAYSFLVFLTASMVVLFCLYSDIKKKGRIH
jgi:O-antigen/teichoic acid export membrane protein